MLTFLKPIVRPSSSLVRLPSHTSVRTLAANASPARTRAVLVGLPYNHPMVPADLQEKVRVAITSVLERTKRDAPDLHLTLLDAVPEEDFKVFEDRLRAIGHVDALAIGFGVRGKAELTPFFEGLINSGATVLASSPGSKIVFNTFPDNTLEAIRRWFPAPKK
ncbi:hypothetical protein HKX48_002221 [Thoreauomyces humboldtii]|nr:hypothetical protein HKX48_002221 [Thoreauomyces humboldtii]